MNMSELDKQQLISDRSTGLGGTDAGAICGISPWRSAVDVFMEKTNQEVKSNNPARKKIHILEMGNRLENTVIDVFEDRTGIKVQRDIPVIRHAKFSYLLAHVDGLIDKKDGTKGVFEAKTAGSNAVFNKTWGNQTQGMCDKTDIPIQYWYQCQWYMTITNRTFCYLAVLLGGIDDFRYYYFERDYMLSVQMRKKMKDFWLNNVQKRVAPPAQSQKDSMQLHPKQDSDEMRASNERILKVTLKNKAIRLKLKSLFNQKEKLDGIITEYIGKHKGISHDGRIIATWKDSKRGRILKLY